MQTPLKAGIGRDKGKQNTKIRRFWDNVLNTMVPGRFFLW